VIKAICYNNIGKRNRSEKITISQQVVNKLFHFLQINLKANFNGNKIKHMAPETNCTMMEQISLFSVAIITTKLAC